MNITSMNMLMNIAHAVSFRNADSITRITRNVDYILLDISVHIV